MPLNIDDLRSFILVAHERSVSRAAKKLGVTQQSTSERIRRLEGRLGTQLFERLPHGMAPTAAGFRLLPYATQSLSLLDEAIGVIGGDDLVRVALQRNISNAVQSLLDPAAEDESIRVELTDDSTEAIVASLLANEIDAAIGVFNNLDQPRKAPLKQKRRKRTGSPGSPGSSGDGDDAASSPAVVEDPASYQRVKVVAELLFSDALKVAAPVGHSLTQQGQPLLLADLMSLSVAARGSVDAVAHNGFEGVQIGPQSVLDPQIAEGLLVEIPVDAPGWVMPISIAFRESEAERQGIVQLASTLRERKAAAGHSGSQTNGTHP